MTFYCVKSLGANPLIWGQVLQSKNTHQERITNAFLYLNIFTALTGKGHCIQISVITRMDNSLNGASHELTSSLLIKSLAAGEKCEGITNSLDNTFWKVKYSVSALNGGLPSSIWYMTHPRAHRSTLFQTHRKNLTSKRSQIKDIMVVPEQSICNIDNVPTHHRNRNTDTFHT